MSNGRSPAKCPEAQVLVGAPAAHKGLPNVQSEAFPAKGPTDSRDIDNEQHACLQVLNCVHCLFRKIWVDLDSSAEHGIVAYRNAENLSLVRSAKTEHVGSAGEEPER